MMYMGLDHLQFDLNYEYSLGLMKQQKLDVIFALDMNENPVYTVIDLESLLKMDEVVNWVEYENE